jgi:hypothetical protein
MEDTATLIESLIARAETYCETSKDLFKLKAIDKLSGAISSLASGIAFFITAMTVFFILNIGVALWIGDLLGKTYYGFFIVAAFYILVGIILYIFRDSLIKTPVTNSIIRKLVKKSDYANY